MLQHPYFGESEATEWRRWFRVEKEVVDWEEQEHRAWRLEEAQRKGYLMDHGPLYEERGTIMRRRCEMR